MTTKIDYDPLNPVSVSERQNALERYLNVENEFMAAKGYAKSKEATLRKLAVRVIVENSRWEDYDAFVPYLALIYFDRFISYNRLPNVIRDLRAEVVLIANSCLKIAYEMRDSTFNPLTFLRRTSMIEHRSVILQMELAILRGLDWKTRAVTAVCFVNMFVRMSPAICQINQKTLNEIVIQAQGDIEFTKFRPSVIAAGAILAACKINKKGRDMYNNCYKFLLGLRFAYEDELKGCMIKATKMCINKRIYIGEDEQRAHPGSSSKPGGSTSSQAGEEPPKETTSEDTEIDQETQQRQDKEPLMETSERTQAEVDVETQEKHDEEPLMESSERAHTEVDAETQQKCEKEPSMEISEATHTEVDLETQQKHDKEPVKVTRNRHKPGRKQLADIEETEDETEIQHRPGKEPVSDIQKAAAETEIQHRSGKEPVLEVGKAEAETEFQHRPGKESVLERGKAEAETEFQHRPGKEGVLEKRKAEAETEIGHRPGKEPVPEKQKAEAETEIQHRPGKEPVLEKQKAEAETEIRHKPGKQSVPEILPVRRFEDLDPMNFELKWLTWEPGAIAENIDPSLFHPRIIIGEPEVHIPTRTAGPEDDNHPSPASPTNVLARCCPVL